MRETDPMRPHARVRGVLVGMADLAAAGAACGLLAACGGGAHASRGAASARKNHPAAGAQRLTHARAVAFARAVMLTAADLPGFSVDSDRRGETASDRQLEARLRRCAGGAGRGPGLLAHESRSYRVRRSLLDLGVSSEVGVARTPALAAAELVALRSPRVRACFSHYLQLLLKAGHRDGALQGPVRILAGTPPAPGATGSFGWRITATFRVDRVPLSLYVDILGFVLGPSRVTLVSSGALRPFPAVIQQRLYTLLLARASARAL